MSARQHMAAMAAIIGLILIVLLLSGCAGKPGVVIRDRPVDVLVPVVQPCAGQRPDPVMSLRDTILRPEWDQRDVRQKTATIGKQALDRLTYTEKLEAATAGCPSAADPARSQVP